MFRFIGLVAFVLFALTIDRTAHALLFTNCGATGATGPNQAQCDAAYGAGVVSVTGGIQKWTVPTTGSYRIEAIGAAGAAGNPAVSGGRGAKVTADFVFSSGDMLQLAVGQMGLRDGAAGVDEGNGGGGGGSFVVTLANTPLLIAGGGGGTRSVARQNGHDASTTQFGKTGSGSGVVGGGAVKTTDLGLGGQVSASSWGSGGGGFNGNGAGDFLSVSGGASWFNGLLGGTAPPSRCPLHDGDGGFGGGGSGNGCWGGGGGGGYSGGDGGFVAGGGGSYLSGLNQIAMAGVGTGHGSINITPLFDGDLPEPATIALFGVGLAGLGLAVRRKRVAN